VGGSAPYRRRRGMGAGMSTTSKRIESAGAANDTSPERHAAAEVIAARLRELVSGPIELHLERGRSSSRIRLSHALADVGYYALLELDEDGVAAFRPDRRSKRIARSARNVLSVIEKATPLLEELAAHLNACYEAHCAGHAGDRVLDAVWSASGLDPDDDDVTLPVRIRGVGASTRVTIDIPHVKMPGIATALTRMLCELVNLIGMAPRGDAANPDDERS
jgi:hypothetical protein